VDLLIADKAEVKVTTRVKISHIPLWTALVGVQEISPARKWLEGGGLTPLHLAAERGHIEVMKSLLAAGADVLAKDDDHWTPLHFAARDGRKDAAALLLENHADVNARAKSDRWTPLLLAAFNNQLAVAELLLSNGADIGAKTNHGKSGVRLAQDKKFPKMEELLRQHGGQ